MSERLEDEDTCHLGRYINPRIFTFTEYRGHS